MTDPDLVAKRLALIETLVADLKSLARPERMDEDIREERFIEHTLQLAIQATIDVASHIVSDERLGEPRTNQDLFGILAKRGWLDAALCSRLASAAGFRNVLVHGYTGVDLAVVEDIVRNRLGDRLDFANAIRQRL